MGYRDFDKEIACFTERQMEAVKKLDSGKVKYLLYGGALGGGKSYFLRWYGLRRLMELGTMGYKGVVGMLACEDYPSLKDRHLSKIGIEFPAGLGEMHTDHVEYGRCFKLNGEYGGGVLVFRNLDDASKYQSAEFALILVDELTKNSYETFTYLRTRLRWKGLRDSEAFFIGASNPGGIGHGWVKSLWMDKVFGPEWSEEQKSQFAYVKSLATDNPHLDKAYWVTLSSLPEGLRKAFRDGDWNIFVGQAFPELNKEVHGYSDVDIPLFAPLYMTFDWGFGKPFSVGWWWVDNDGRVYRFSSWYGAAGPNMGLRLTDSEIAEGIVERERQLGISSRMIIRYAGHDCFNKRPDYQGGGQGPTTAEVFAKYGLIISPMDANRKLKIRQFREYLRVQEDGRPMMLISKDDDNFFRTVSALTMSKTDPEDVDTSQEDHIYDEACHICMARPLKMMMMEKEKNYVEKIIEQVESGGGEVSEFNKLPWEEDGNFYGLEF